MSKKLLKMQKQLSKLRTQIKNESNRLKAIEAKKRQRKIEIIGEYILGKAEKDKTLKELVIELKENGLLKNKTDIELFETKSPQENDSQELAGSAGSNE